MDHNPIVAILMATYNGGDYLIPMLESIINQTYKSWLLYLCDDGSTDNTLSIITDYTQRYGNIIQIDSPYIHQGAKVNFMYMLSQVSHDYYMFADQDDIWVESKIEISLAELVRYELLYPFSPIIVHTDLVVMDRSMNQISASFWRSSKIDPQILNSFNYLGVCNCVTGCTMLFNEWTKRISLPMPCVAPMHDWWIAINVAKQGGLLLPIYKSTVLYRQHSSNVVGARKIDAKYFLRKLLHVRTTLLGHRELFKFHKKIGYGCVGKYYLYKILYTFRRNL